MTGIAWFDDLEVARLVADEVGKPLLLDFFSPT